jgi:TrmH family RNA methyltransferase
MAAVSVKTRDMTPLEIGKHNRKLIELRKAIRRETLTRDGLLPVEGPILIEEARRSGLEIVEIFIRSGSPPPPVSSAAVYEMPPETFETIQSTEHSQGVIAAIRVRQFVLKDVLERFPALIVVLGRLQDPGNAGTILRIAESFYANGCIALRGTASLHNSKAVRASAGSIFRLPHVANMELNKTAEALRSRGISIIGTSPAADRTIGQWDWRLPSAVLIGNEGSGLNRDELASCDALLRIPHSSAVESLNSAVAAAVILYEASKQRH